MSAPTTAVIGGGISGLTAALVRAKAGDVVHLFEASATLGGKIAETTLDGVTIPTGPDAFLARRTEVADLASELGLGDQLVHPSAGSARIYRGGVLHPLPPNVLGIPATTELGTSGLISDDGVRRAAEDLRRPGDAPNGDESVGAMVRRRLGDEVLEYLVDPLLGGINAGDSDRLSVESGVPQLDQLRRRGPSLIESASETVAEGAGRRGPVFASIEGGLTRLVDRAANVLSGQANVYVHLGGLASIERSAAGFSVSGTAVDRVIVATPATSASALVEPFAPEAAEALGAIDYSSVGLVLFVLPAETLSLDRSVSGILVPRMCGFNVTAISFASHKWPALATEGRQVLRVSVGRRTDERWQTSDDHALIDVVRSEVSEILEQVIPAGPTHVARWMRSLPQYDVGHADRIKHVDAAIDGVPGLSFAGAWRHGLGLPACVASGRGALVNNT